MTAIVIGSKKYYSRTFSLGLRKKFNLIFMDHRGFQDGNETKDESYFALENILQDIEDLRKELNLEKMVLIGHSVHALTALEYAKKYPEHVSHLVMISVPPIAGLKLYKIGKRNFSEMVFHEERRMLIWDNMVKFGLEDFLNSYTINRILAWGPMIWYKYDYDASHLWEGVKISKTAFKAIFHDMFDDDYDITKGLQKVTRPVLLALGACDYWTPSYLWDSVRDKFADLTVRIFEKSGHNPQFEDAENFNSELCKFCGLEIL